MTHVQAEVWTGATPRARLPIPQGPTGNWQTEGAKDATSDALLQSRHWVRLYDCAGRLCLHHNDLAEDLPLASLGSRLLAGLDHAKSWESELASGFDLLGGNICKARNDLACHGLLELELFSNVFGDGSLGHSLCGHSLLHSLHRCWRHAETS